MRMCCTVLLAFMLVGCSPSRFQLATVMCYADGYKDLRIVGFGNSHRFFCMRLVNGTTEIKEINPE